MLLEFGLGNFFCFKEGVTISYKLDSKCPSNISLGRRFSTVIGVKGANGSGKTHLLKGLNFLREFCTNSFSYKPEDSILIEPFYDSKKPTELFAEILVKETIYLYEVSLTQSEVIRETIYRKIKNGRKSKIVERVGTKLTTRIAEFAQLDAIKLRRNASLISTAHQYEFDELQELYDFFTYIISNVSYSGLEEIPREIEFVAKFLDKHKKILSFVNSFIASCDTGISNIDIVKLENPENKSEEFAPIFVHKVGKSVHPVTEYTESSGTKALFRNLPSYKLVLETGGVLILDEFDTHLHPHILPKLLQLFLDPKSNKKNAQLLISTHDAEILEILGRYRTYLVNKENNESYAYRLDEIPGDILRNDRPILPVYSDGKIGGVPKI